MEVTLAGYVDDLAAEYTGAWAVVVPLRQGAGVKFKTVEALLHDVPTVTTTVGAEGITGPDLFAGLQDDPRAIADALVRVLADPSAFRERSAAAQRWARECYGRETFALAVRSSYGLDCG
jgi:glycosyltransferase involved in cell wall biosynthesis